MQDFGKVFDALRGTTRVDQIPGLVLREAIAMTGTEVEFSSRIEEDWRRATQQPDYPHLQAAARLFLAGDEGSRLSSLGEIMERGRSTGIVWLDQRAAAAFVDLLGEMASLRCAFAPSAMPALEAALRAKREGRALAVRFIDINLEFCDFVRLAAAAIGVEVEVIAGHPLERLDGDGFEAELCMPHFGADIRDRAGLPKSTLDRLGAAEKGRLRYEPVAMADALVHAPQARTVFSFTAGALFRMVGIEATAREEMIDSGRISAVCGVPPGMIYDTTGITTCVVVLEPEGNRYEAIRFIDLADDRFATRSARGRFELRKGAPWGEAITGDIGGEAGWARDVPLGEVRAQGSILAVERYLRTDASKALEAFFDDHDTSPLEDVVELVRPRAVQKSDDGEHVIREASPGDVAETGYLARPPRETRLARGAMRHARNQRLQSGDVILSIKGTIGRVGIVPDEAPGPEEDGFWTAGQSLVILRPRGKIAPEVLYEYLTDARVQDHIASLAGGAVIQSITAKDLAALRIPVPAKAEQDRVVRAFTARQDRYAEIARIHREIEAERANTWPHRELAAETAE